MNINSNDRRNFILGSTLALAATPLVHAKAATTNDVVTTVPDGINPVGVRTAGVRMIPVVGGKYKVWTKRVGSGTTKILLLHGGPAFSHEYLEAMASFLPPAGYEIYFYDQLGVNNSDQPDDPSLWTLARYLEEVEEVRKGLGLQNFVLYGHSWGGMLAIEYALKYQVNLKGLVISNMAASIQAYLTRVASIKAKLPGPQLQKLNELESSKDYDNPEYERIMMEFMYPQMICRLTPWPEAVVRTFKHVNKSIYALMQGPSELEVLGNLRGWDRWDQLRNIKTRTLVMGAHYDEMDPADIRRMAELMPNAKAVICPHGSHLAMWDDQAIYFRHLLDFLSRLAPAKQASVASLTPGCQPDPISQCCDHVPRTCS